MLGDLRAEFQQGGCSRCTRGTSSVVVGTPGLHSFAPVASSATLRRGHAIAPRRAGQLQCSTTPSSSLVPLCDWLARFAHLPHAGSKRAFCGLSQRPGRRQTPNFPRAGRSTRSARLNFDDVPDFDLPDPPRRFRHPPSKLPRLMACVSTSRFATSTGQLQCCAIRPSVLSHCLMSHRMRDT